MILKMNRLQNLKCEPLFIYRLAKKEEVLLNFLLCPKNTRQTRDNGAQIYIRSNVEPLFFEIGYGSRLKSSSFICIQTDAKTNKLSDRVLLTTHLKHLQLITWGTDYHITPYT